MQEIEGDHSGRISGAGWREKQHISRIERGVAACSIDLLPMLSIALQVSTDYLLMGKSIDKELIRTQLLSVISQLTIITQGL